MSSKRRLALVGVACMISAGIIYPAAAEDDYCRWGGDNGQSLRCFDCMKLMHAGDQSYWINTCRRTQVVFPVFVRRLFPQ